MYKRIVIFILFLFFMNTIGLGQCITSPVYVTKKVGQTANITWDYPTDSAIPYKFRMRQASNAVGKYPIVMDNIAGTIRSVTFTVPNSAGTYYYFLEACNDVNCSKQTPGSNHVSITVTR